MCHVDAVCLQNIMDLIPPVEAVGGQGDPETPGCSARRTPSIGIPLQPPPGLMMRALSPPASLLPDFGDVASLSLLGDAMGSGTMTASSDAIARPTTTTATTAVKRELQSMKTGGIGTTAAMRRKAEMADGPEEQRHANNTTTEKSTHHQTQDS